LSMNLANLVSSSEFNPLTFNDMYWKLEDILLLGLDRYVLDLY
jgi:hypothetical protein